MGLATSQSMAHSVLCACNPYGDCHFISNVPLGLVCLRPLWCLPLHKQWPTWHCVPDALMGLATSLGIVCLSPYMAHHFHHIWHTWPCMPGVHIGVTTSGLLKLGIVTNSVKNVTMSSTKPCMQLWRLGEVACNYNWLAACSYWQQCHSYISNEWMPLWSFNNIPMHK